jgi:flagellar M-ring protein FliF
MEPLKQFFGNVGRLVGRMTPSQVMMLLGVTAGTIVGIVLMVGWVSDVSYSRLYSGIDDAEAGEVINYLNDNKIPYKVTGNGQTIEIPSTEVYKTRISLAAEGLPRSGSIGYSIFDQNNLGMTDFLQNLNFRRALEGELTRTITQLSEVQAARVHIVMPKDRLFRQDKKEATASIVLKLAGNRGLSKRQTNGIAHLVAASVEGLKPGNIAIIDYEGNLLTSGQEEDPIAGLSGTQMEVRKNVEAYLEEKAQSMLDGVLGVGKSVVRLSADLDFQQLERTSETFDPNAASVRSEERTKSANATTDKPSEQSESTSEGDNETTITNYELNKTVEHIINAVGGVKRLSVALMVDGTYSEVENESGDLESIYQPRSQEELDRLSAIVKSAIGFDAERNDQVEIVNMPFDRRDLNSDQEALDSMYLREFYLDIGKKVGLVLLGLLVLFYFKKKSSKLFAALKTMVPAASPVRSPNMGPMMAEGGMDDETPIVLPERRQPTLVQQMQETAKKEPEEMARVIRTIMSD